MREILLILASTTRYVRNFMRFQWRESKLNVWLAVCFASLFSLGLFLFFFFLFRAVVRLEGIGIILMNRLLAMFYLATFSMLIFSNLIVSLTTLYRSEDMEFLMVQPVQRTSIFWAKYFETLFYSSWPFVYLFLPLFFAFGLTRHFGFLFYILSFGAFTMFLLMAAAIGQFLTLFLAGFIPTRRRLWLSMGALLVFTVLMGFRVLGGTMIIQAYGQFDFETILSSLKIGGNPWLPSYWAARATTGIGEGNWSEFWYRAGLLAANLFLGLELLHRLARRIYYRAWAQAREGLSHTEEQTRTRSPFSRLLRCTFSVFSRCHRAFGQKDILTFVRDPWQWTQFAMLFGLLTIYLFNLRTTPLSQFIPFWQYIVTYFNLGATSFILAIITTRFVYPMLSMEGSKSWLWAISPVARTAVIFQKFWLAWSVSFIFAILLLVGTSLYLGVTWPMLLLSSITLLAVSLGLTSFAVGMGAIYPNFNTDNAARIANGIGGVITVALSLGYVIVAILLEAIPTYLLVSKRIVSYTGQNIILISATVLAVALHSLAIFLPMKIGLEKWRKIDF